MRIATAAYPMDFLESFEAYEAKLRSWVSEAAAAGAQLLVFPEYGAMELATLAGRDVALDLEGSLRAVSDRVPRTRFMRRWGGSLVFISLQPLPRYLTPDLATGP